MLCKAKLDKNKWGEHAMFNVIHTLTIGSFFCHPHGFLYTAGRFLDL